MRLIPLTYDEMIKYADGLTKEADAIKANAMRLSWYTRGGISYADVLNLSKTETNELNKLIDDNLEITKKTKMSFF